MSTDKRLYADQEEKELFEWAKRMRIDERAEVLNNRRVRVAGNSVIGIEESAWPGPIRSIIDLFTDLFKIFSKQIINGKEAEHERPLCIANDFSGERP